MTGKAIIALVSVCAVVSMGALPPRSQLGQGDAGKGGSQLSLTADLRDGTHIVCKLPLEAEIEVDTDFARVQLPLKLISTVRFEDDLESVKVVFHNGDKLSGVMTTESFRPQTCFGEVSIRPPVIASIKIDKLYPALGPPTALFDGDSLNGWHACAPWTVSDGAIVCPTTGSINALLAKTRIHGPFELTYEIQLLRLRRQDAKGIYVNDASGRVIAVVRLDDRPNTFHIRGNSKSVASVPLTVGQWYRVRCLLDDAGKLTAWLNDSVKLETTIPVRLPLTIGLQCERSGARFRNIVLRQGALPDSPRPTSSGPPLWDARKLPPTVSGRRFMQH